MELVMKDLTPGQVKAIMTFYETLVSGTDTPVANAVAPVMSAMSAAVPAAVPAAAPVMSAGTVVGAPVMSAADVDARDTRGVPYNPEFHAATTGRTGGKNEDGSWRRKRGCNSSAADAYEAQYLGHTETVNPDPGNQAVLDYANKLAAEGKLSGDHVAKIMAMTGSATHDDLLRDAPTRIRVMEELQKLG
jgi:hypothetical protein